MKLNEKHLEAIQLMTYTNKSLQEIADELGVSINTVYRWRSTPSFKAKLEEEMAHKVEHVRDSFKRDAEDIYGEMYRLMFDEETAPRDKIQIAKYVLDHAVGKSQENISVKSAVEMEVSEKDILEIFDDEEE